MLPRSLLQANHDRTTDQTKVSGAPCPLLLFLVYTCGMESAAQFAALARRDLPFWVRRGILRFHDEPKAAVRGELNVAIHGSPKPAVRGEINVAGSSLEHAPVPAPRKH